MPIQGIGLEIDLKNLGRKLATKEGRNAVAKQLGVGYAQGRNAGSRVLGQVLAGLPEGEEANFIGGVIKAKDSEEARLYA